MVQAVRTLVMVAAVTLAGCAPLKPNLGPPKDIAAAYNSAPTLPNAVKVGESMRDRYSSQVETQLVWERLSGLTLVTLTAVAADLAIRGVARTEIVGLGVAAGGVYAGSNFVNGKPQQYIYAAGANAVQCALDTMQPLSLAYGIDGGNRNRLAAGIPQIQRQMQGLEAGLRRYPNRTSGPIARARATVERARGFLPQARQALNVLDGAGPRLRGALSGIQQQVTTAVIANSPNLQSLLDQLGKELPAAGSRILGVTLPGIPEKPDVKTSELGEELEGPTAVLETLLADTEDVVELVRAKPSEDALRQCRVDLQQAGLTMVVTPGEISVKPGQAATASVSGGVLPYRATWIGPRPPADHVQLQVETGRGEVTVTASNAAQPATYTLLVADAAKGRETVPVAVAAGGGTGGTRETTGGTAGTGTSVTQSSAPQTPPTGPACTKEILIQKLQQALLKEGVKVVRVDGKDKTLVVDGCRGPITVAAARQYYASQIPNVTADQIPKEDKLLNEVASMLDVKV